MTPVKSLDRLICCAYLYLLLPILIFAAGWLRWYYALPLCAGLLYSFFIASHTPQEREVYHININGKLLLCLAILAGWVIASGVGGLCWQNRWDHMFRNTLFEELCRTSWPVLSTTANGLPEILCYYIGFWMPSAIVTKITGSLTAGYLFQTLYAYCGVVIAVLLLFRWLKAIKLRAVIILILFSGLDVITYWVATEFWGTKPAPSLNDFFYAHHELYSWKFNSSSNTTLLFWLYNQIVPFWVGGMLLLTTWKNSATLLFTYSLMMLFSPFPFVALFPLIVYRCLVELKNFKQLFSLPNISGFLWMAVIAFYFGANNNVGTFILLPVTEYGAFALFLAIEFLVFLPFIWNAVKKDIIFWILFATMLICNIVRFEADDFAWRTTIPVAGYIMLKLIQEAHKINRFSWQALLLALTLSAGAVTPLSEIRRSVEGTAMVLQHKQEGPLLSPPKESVFNLEMCRNNFIATGDSFFTQYLMKK